MGRGGERERQKDLMKGYEEPAPIYIHYQRFGFSQSLTEEAPVSLSHSSPSTPPPTVLSSLHHCGFSVSTPKNHPTSRCFLSNKPAEREKLKERELTRGPNWARA